MNTQVLQDVIGVLNDVLSQLAGSPPSPVVNRFSSHLRKLIICLETNELDYSYIESLEKFGTTDEEVDLLTKMQAIFAGPEPELEVGKKFLSEILVRLRALKTADVIPPQSFVPLTQIGKGKALDQFKNFHYGDEFKNFICPNPFMYAEVRAKGELSTCCYLPFTLGNASRENIKTAWNSEEMQELRRSILSGEYSYCDKSKCAAMQQATLPFKKGALSYQLPYSLIKKEDIEDNYLKDVVSNNKVAMSGGPRAISLEDDPSCNLSCPSCRPEVQMLKSMQSDETYSLQMKLVEDAGDSIEELWVCGAGDPLAAKSYRRFFSEFDSSKLPNAKFRLDTNGMLLNEKTWNSVLAKIQERIFLIAVSVDAATSETYHQIRRGGYFPTLLDNLRFISELPQRKNGTLKYIIRLIVQEGNFREMKKFVELGRELQVDSVVFSVIQNWGHISDEEYLGQAVHKPSNPHHQELVNILADPIFEDSLVDLGNLTELYYEKIIKTRSVHPIAKTQFVEEEIVRTTSPRYIAFYLPQFHPIPENDRWWGKGFTEWTNVAKALPLYEGHYQPHLPADLGFYDLRIPEVRNAQAEMAKRYGIEAFCYWHYWFAGTRLLERPFAEVVANGEPDFPFCLGWANQTWSGIWHGAPERILIEQRYLGLKDYEQHFYELLPAFSDRRYLKVNGRNLFLIYDPSDLPNAREFTDYWRNLAVREGIADFHFVAHQVQNPESFGCDACVSNAPFVQMNSAPVPVQGFREGKVPTVKSYSDFVRYLRHLELAPKEYPLVMPNWDNTPRCTERGVVLEGATPELFRVMLDDAINKIADRTVPDQRIIFIKAWNEWAEGNYLEPDTRFGTGFLEAVRDSAESTPKSTAVFEVPGTGTLYQ